MLVPLLIAIVLTATACGAEGDDGARPARHGSDADFAGLVAEDVFGRPGGYRRDALARQRRLGVKLLRQTFDWSLIERRRGSYDFRRQDAFVIAAARAGIRVLPILFRPPAFRSSAPSRGRARGTYPPRRPQDMARFAATLVRRYGPDGGLWSRNPTAPKLPIVSWQVWNEPNLPVNWPPRPDPAGYASLLRVTAAAIRATDPKAEIVTAGLSESRAGMPFKTFLDAFYRARAKGSFDTLAVHPYARDAQGTLAGVEGARQLLRRHGDGAHIWVTELGWASGGPPSSFTVGERGQARRLQRSLQDLWGLRRQLGLRGVVVFNWRDAPPYPGTPDFWGYHSGLLRRDGSPKLALTAFERAVADFR